MIYVIRFDFDKRRMDRRTLLTNFGLLKARSGAVAVGVRPYGNLVPFLGLLLLFGLFASGEARAGGRSTDGALRTSLAAYSPFTVADFDGDQRPDLASVAGGQIGATSTNYSVEVRLTAWGLQVIQLTAPPGGLQIEARDVNGDHAVDLVLTTTWFKQPVAVLLNNGHGGFSRAEPREFPGVFADSSTNWSTQPSQASSAVGIPTFSRGWICSDARDLSEIRGAGDSTLAYRSGFLLDSCLNPYASRAPPSEVCYL